MFEPVTIRLLRIANTFAIAANALGTLVVLGLVVVLNLEVFMRGVFSAPLPGTYEIVQFSVVLIVFLQLPDVARVGKLTRSDGFLNFLGRRAPTFENVISRIINALAAIFMGLVAYITFPDIFHMWETGGYFGIRGVFTIPWWPVKLVITFGTALSCIIFALRVVTTKHETVPSLAKATRNTAS